MIEVSGSRQIVQWDRLAARVVMQGGKRVFTGAVIPLRSEEGKLLTDELGNLLHGLAEGVVGGLATDAFRREAAGMLRELAPMIGGVRIAQILASLRRPLPQLVNRDGDPLEFVEARYALTSRQGSDVMARLDAEPALRRAGARPAKWDWLGPASDKLPEASAPGEKFAVDSLADGDAGRVVLASLTQSGGRLVLSLNSRRRLERVRAFIEPLLAGLVGEPEIEAKSVAEVMAETPEPPVPARRAVPKRVGQEVTKSGFSTITTTSGWTIDSRYLAARHRARLRVTSADASNWSRSSRTWKTSRRGAPKIRD